AQRGYVQNRARRSQVKRGAVDADSAVGSQNEGSVGHGGDAAVTVVAVQRPRACSVLDDAVVRSNVSVEVCGRVQQTYAPNASGVAAAAAADGAGRLAGEFAHRNNAVGG